ncbi:hypothetical protein D9Q98_007331 [Chlorella vulgaris]|uniref:Uncharacterized protein n=1 Tax=Chlorella vulgaris TaxID=3077 RepID=A0A9D4TL48_CHLVU|nr:hypothetical protein D9Q98_007331 [Chlorella vulgaris]
MAAAATCICLQSACEEGVVNETRLLQLAAAAELKVRKVAAAPADLLVSKAGTTLAFMLWRSDAGGGNMTERAARLASSFKHAHVLVPHALIGKPLVLDAAASCNGPIMVPMPMGADFTDRAVALAIALLPAVSEEAAWRKEQAHVAATSEAVNHVLLGLPLPGDGDAAHHANMLRMLGSLQHISQRHGEEIAAHTDIDSRSAAAIAAFFGRWGAEPEAQGLTLPVPQMQHL